MHDQQEGFGFMKWLVTLPYGLVGLTSGKAFSMMVASPNWMTTAIITICTGVSTATLSAVVVFFVNRTLKKWWKDGALSSKESDG